MNDFEVVIREASLYGIALLNSRLGTGLLAPLHEEVGLAVASVIYGAALPEEDASPDEVMSVLF